MNTALKIVGTVVGLMVAWWLLKVAFKVAIVVIAGAVVVAGGRAVWRWLNRRG